MFTMEKELQELKEVTRIALLYDIYGTLLTDKANESMSLYLNEDWSMSEIAEALSVSRQAVYDSLKRSLDHLERYEEQLGLYARYKKISGLLDALEEDIRDGKKEEALSHTAEIRRSL